MDVTAGQAVADLIGRSQERGSKGPYRDYFDLLFATALLRAADDGQVIVQRLLRIRIADTLTSYSPSDLLRTADDGQVIVQRLLSITPAIKAGEPFSRPMHRLTTAVILVGS
jgi:hypothetical protein